MSLPSFDLEDAPCKADASLFCVLERTALLQSRSHGKARPHPGATLIVEKVRHRAGIDDDATALEQTIAELNATQRGNSWSLPVPAGAEAATPVWHGPEHWIETVRILLGTDRGRQLVTKHHTNADTVAIVASELAAHADGLTGRGVTVSDATLCEAIGFQVKTIRRARYVLRDLGLARSLATGRPLNLVEQAAAWLHHGGAQTKAASVWALMIPREAAAVARPLTPRRKSASLGRLSRAAHAAAAAAANTAPSTPDRPVGPPTTNLSRREVCSGANYSPSARERDGKNSKKSRRRTEPRPRSLDLQRTAAELIHHIPGIDRQQWISTPGSGSYVRLPGPHIGWVADLIADAGIDSTWWTGRAMAARLSRYMVEQGYSWPNRITNPGGFLRALLAAVDWTEQIPAMPAAVVRERRRELQRQDELEQQQRQAERARIAAQERQEAARKAAAKAYSGECGLCHDTGWIVAFGAGEPIAPIRCLCPGLDRPPLDLPAPSDPAAPEPEQPVVDEVVAAAAEAEQDRRAAELDAAAGQTCLMCSEAPGTVRTSMPSRPAVCDPCWHAAGFEGVPSVGVNHSGSIQRSESLAYVVEGGGDDVGLVLRTPGQFASEMAS
ncbi:hypothetical protein ABZW96_36365 [Nocardia sp. NPDC004168]|uniref:hypothetical protein n=1 Tax=Nocardia sp. NPDC004168 TaxID=3154452 RepID=UPI0033B3376E